MDHKRYGKIISLLKKHHLSMSSVARHLGCSPSNVQQFVTGEHNSIEVARGIADLTNSPARVARITGLPVDSIHSQSAPGQCSSRAQRRAS